MIISCSHCHGENEKCPVCGGKRLALISFGQVFFWRKNLSVQNLYARKLWRLARQTMEGVVLVYIILAIILAFYLVLYKPNTVSNNFLARLGFTAVVAILYFFYQTHRFRPSREKVAPVFLPMVILPEEENGLWQKHSHFEKINCADSFSGDVLNLIDEAALLAKKKNQIFCPLHLFYLLVYKTEVKHFFERANIDLIAFKKRLVKSLESLPSGSGASKEVLEIFLLAYLEAIESGEKTVGLNEILIAFFAQKNFTAEILGGLGLSADDARNLSSWATAQKNVALKIKHVKKNAASVEREAGLKETFKKIVARAPFLEKENRVFFSYQSLLAAAKIHENNFLQEPSLDKIFNVLNSAAKRVLRQRGIGAMILVEDVNKAAESQK